MALWGSFGDFGAAWYSPFQRHQLQLYETEKKKRERDYALL
jgi:hypothetical protein